MVPGTRLPARALPGLAVVLAALLVLAPARPGAAQTPPKPPTPPTQPTPTDIPPELTVEQAVRIGLERNPQVTGAAAGVRSAAATYRSLAAFPSVTLGVTHAQGTSSAPTLNGTTNDTFVDLGSTIDTSGQRRFQAAGAKATLGATQYGLAETRLTLEQQIRDAYWSLVAARAQLAIADESLKVVQRVSQLTVTQEQAGAAPHQDVIRSSIDVANAQQALVTAQGAERAALGALNTLLARPPLAPVNLAESLSETDAPPDLLPNLPDLAELERRAEANRPLIKQSIEQVHAAEYATKQARAARLPDVTVDYQRSVQQLPQDAVVLSANFPLLDFGAVSGATRAASEATKQAQAALAQTRQQVAQAVAQAYTDYTQAQQLAASYRSDILAPSNRLLGMAQIGYQQGATGILPVIDAETTLRNARTGYITALLALYKARDEVYAATGGVTPPAATAAPRH